MNTMDSNPHDVGATDRLERALENIRSTPGAQQNYSALFDLQHAHALPGVSPDPKVVRALVGQMVRSCGHEERMQQALAEALYSALRNDDRDQTQALLDAGVDPNWKPEGISGFPPSIMSLLCSDPPCSLDQDEAVARLHLLARAGAQFQQPGNPPHPACAIAWPLMAYPRYQTEPTTPYQLQMVQVMVDLEMAAGRPVSIQSCIQGLEPSAVRRVVAYLEPILARVSAEEMDNTVAMPGSTTRSPARL